MGLDPPSYACETHKIDLTDDVTSQLESHVVAGFGVAHAGGRSEPSDMPFSVIVSCPGKAGGEAHDLIFRGFQRS